jgi:TonB family protein
MPISEAPADVNEPKGPAEPSPATEKSVTGSILGLSSAANLSSIPDPEPAPDPEPREPASRAPRGSRWIDYDTHELLEMISELEDERRWARLREGVLWAVLIHILLLFAIFLIPKYLLKMAPVIQSSNIRDQKNFTYLDTPFQPPPKPVKPLLNKPLIDKQTMEELKRTAPPAPQAPVEQKQDQVPAPEQPKAQPAPVIPPNPESQSQVEAPRPAATPKPNFAMGSQNPADQLQEDMRNAMRNHGSQSAPIPGGGGLARHPGAGTGAPDILSDTQGVDFSSWLARWHYITQLTWDPLIPDEVNPPILKSGVVAIRFKVLPNGQVIDMSLDGRSGDTALDRAAWGAIQGSSYPALPRDFHGPYLELRASFLYKLQPR